MTDPEKKPTRRRRSKKKDESASESKDVPSTPSESVGISLIEDRVSPISFTDRGPRLGPRTYVAGGEVSFAWHNTRTGESASLPQPLAVRVKREGGDYVRLEFFFPNSPENEIGADRFDNKTFTLRTGVNPETGKKRGRRFKALVGAGWGRDYLSELDTEARFLKYVCHTRQMRHFDETPTSLRGLAAPHK